MSAPSPSGSHQRHGAAARTHASAEWATAEQVQERSRARGVTRHLARDTPPDGFRVVVVPSSPELNVPTAAALLRVLTRHVSSEPSDDAVSGVDVLTGPPGAIELSVVDHRPSTDSPR